MKYLVTAIFFLASLTTSAQNDFIPKSREAINKACENFMVLFKEGKYGDALSILKANSVIEHDAIDGLEITIKQQLREAIPKYGKVLNFEFVKDNSLKMSIVNRYYLLKFERYFLRVTFTLYNNGSGWMITNFDYDDEIGNLLQ